METAALSRSSAPGSSSPLLPLLPSVQIRFLLFLYLCVLRDLFVKNPSLWPWCAILVALLKHPLVVPKPLNRSLHSLANSQLGSPAGLSYLRCVQKDKWIIADPTPFAAGEFQGGIHIESLADPRD